MPIKSLAVSAVLASTALPVTLLGAHTYMESQIPRCSLDLPDTAALCSDAASGMKYRSEEYRRIFG